MAKSKFAPFDASVHLDSKKGIAEYLTAALEEPNPNAFLLAVANVAKARGMTRIAKDSGLGRQSLSKGTRARCEAPL